MLTRKLLVPALVVAALSGAVPAQAATSSDGTAVCNEAENSHRGGYVLSDGVEDPAPPAFNRGDRMAVGGGAGLDHAADVSPALRQCEPEDGDGGGPTPV